MGYQDNGIYDFRTNPGGTLNYYFNKFNSVRNINAFEELRMAINNGAQIDYSKHTFHARNTLVAKCDYMLAFTWNIDKPEDGGTLDTWTKCRGIRHHISLLNIYPIQNVKLKLVINKLIK